MYIRKVLITLYLIVSFVFPSQERIDRITTLFNNEQIDVLCTFSLFCNEQDLVERIQKRNTTRIMNIEKSLACNTKIKELDAQFLIDTTQRKPSDLANIICDSILKLTGRIA